MYLNSLKQDFQFLDSDSNLINIEDLPAPKNENDIYNNKSNSSNKKIEDFSKYEIIKNREDLKIYKYSNVKEKVIMN